MSPTATATPVLRLDSVSKRFEVRKGLFGRARSQVHAVTDLSLTVAEGETVGLVGESGCGKSTTGRLVMRLHAPTAGSIELCGQSVTAPGRPSPRSLAPMAQMVFQNPFGALSPRLTVRELIDEPLLVQGMRPAERDRRVRAMMERVGLAQSHLDRLPAQFSGGQRQRIMIARALVLEPKLVVLDEPVSALDVSIQAQIINLLEELRTEFGLAYLFIAHDLSVVKHLADRVAVMYLGHLVETGSKQTVFAEPAHPYTRALISAVPVPDPAQRSLISASPIRGELPDPANPPSGCVFRTRCPLAQEICAQSTPTMTTTPSGSQVACHFPEQAAQIPLRAATSAG